MALRNMVYEGDELLRKRSREVGEITDRIRALIEDMWETMRAHNGLGLAAPQVGVLRRVVVIDVTAPEDDADADAEASGTDVDANGAGGEAMAGSSVTADAVGDSAGSEAAMAENSAATAAREGPEGESVAGALTPRQDPGSAGNPIQKFTLVNPEIIWASEEETCAQEGCLSVPGVVGRVSRPTRVRVRARDENGDEFEIEGEGLLAKALCHEIDHLDGILFIDKAFEIEDVEGSPEEEGAED